MTNTPVFIPPNNPCRECRGPHLSRCCPIRLARFDEGLERVGIERELSDHFDLIEEFNERYIKGLKIGEEEEVKGKDNIRFKRRVVVKSFSVVKGVEPEPVRICELTDGKPAEDVRSELFLLFNQQQERAKNFDAMWQTVIEHPDLSAEELPFDDSWDPDDCRQFTEEFEEFASLHHCS